MKVETKLGVIEYRYPNIVEGPRFMQACGLTPKKMSDQKWIEENELEMLASAIENSEKFVTKIDVEYEGKKVKEFSKLFEIREMQMPLYNLASDILKSLQPEDKKKDK